MKELTKKEIDVVIQQHEYMKNVYFWKSPGKASLRRAYEKQHSIKVDGLYDGKEISLECRVECSCKNIYYKGFFYIDGKKCTIRKVKGLIK